MEFGKKTELSRAQEGSGGPPHPPRPRDQVQLQVEGSQSLDSRGWRKWGAGPRDRAGAATLTFADDPVEDGLQLLDADLHVLGEEAAWHPPQKGSPSAPQGPSPTPRPTSPASCLKRVLKFSSISSSESTCWVEKGEGR